MNECLTTGCSCDHKLNIAFHNAFATQSRILYQVDVSTLASRCHPVLNSVPRTLSDLSDWSTNAKVGYVFAVHDHFA